MPHVRAQLEEALRNADLRAQIEEAVRTGLFRPPPDPTYADGDDATWMGVDWPAVTRQVQVFGRRVNLVDTGGDGPVLLFLHGLGANWQNWLLNIPVFMASHRCIAPDLPGFGASEMPAEPITIQNYGRIVDALCQALGVERATVIGSSMGGFVGAELAIAFPTRVDRLVLVSAAGLSIEYQIREPLLAVARVSSATRRYWMPYNELVVRRPRLRRAALQGVLRYPEKLSGPLTWELIQAIGKRGLVPALDALMSYSFRRRLGEIGIPTLIVWGRNDLLVPVGDADRFAALIGDNARVVIFEDTAHAPMLERPTRFNAVLAEFLAGSPAPEAGVRGVSVEEATASG